MIFRLFRSIDPHMGRTRDADADILFGERVIDMRDHFPEYIDPSASTFTSLLMNLRREPRSWAKVMAHHRATVEFWTDWDEIFPERQAAKSVPVAWLEDQLFPRFA